MRRLKLRSHHEIAPDEIFLDSSNIPEFDRNQFEGRIEKTISRRTLYITGTFFLAIGCFFLFKISALQIAQGDKYQAISENNTLHHSLIFSERGAITDRNGKLLAWDTIDPNQTDYSLRAYIKEPGINNLLGYVKYPKKDKYGFYYNTDYNGADGIEQYFNGVLSGESGLKINETDALGHKVSESMIRPAKKGDNLALSIDLRLQKAMFQAIKNTADSSGFKGGAGVIMDVNTGEVLASVTYPEYDSNILTDGKDTESIKAILSNDSNPFLDRVTSGLYSPGSIVKPFFALAALEEQIISPQKEIESTGSLKLANPYRPGEFSVFNDWKAHGWTDMRKAIAVSSDVYFYQIGGGFTGQQGLGIERIDKYSKMFGFSTVIENSFFTGKKGNIPTPEWKKETFGGDIWRVGDTYNTSIGQYGFQVTPIQAVRAVAALANGGKLLEPTIQLEDKAAIGRATTVSVQNPEYYKVIREGMRMTVTDGTAQSINVPYVNVAAKTGTAQVGTRNQYINSWVVGFFPYDKPKYAFALLLERGPNSITVGASPAFRFFLDSVNLTANEYFQ
ncbi:MAG: hypothetical protein RL094_438 [Candidatus Parcubacteria bacterium]|jgi:penicillin-binding protein 2